MQNQPENKYSFTKTIPTAITFDMPDKEGKPLNYLFRLPSANDLAPLRDAEKTRSGLEAQIASDTSTPEQKEAARAALEALNDKANQLMNSLVAPVGHDVKFEDALEDVPVSIAKAVQEMMLTEMGVTGE